MAIGEDSLADSKLVFAENGRRVSDFRLTLYKWSDDSHLLDEQQLLYLTSVYQPQRFFQAWTAHNSSWISIMSGDMERMCFKKLTMQPLKSSVIWHSSIRKLRMIHS
ncbi:hypothetical protein TNCV_3540221 [Trichonephila clavipes]|nr:hypothetical protein TNCV_3540221 [Trichonephila clavipes]